MANRIHMLHYKSATQGATPAASEMLYGELAMRYKNDDEKLFVKNTSNNIVEFSPDHTTNTRIDEQDERLSNSIGLTEETDTDSRKTYSYKPSNEMLSECQTMNQSVETLATQLKNCLDSVEKIKANQYFIETNFDIQASSDYTAETVTYSTTCNGVATVPKSVTITKSVNDGDEETILSNESTAQGSVTSEVKGAKERFTILVTPNLTGALQTRVEKNRFICYVGSNTGDTLDLSGLQSLSKTMSEGKEFECTVSTTEGSYIWLCVPSSLGVALVTSGGILVPLASTQVSLTIDGFGTFNCYRSANQLKANEWELVVKHVLT